MRDNVTVMLPFGSHSVTHDPGDPSNNWPIAIVPFLAYDYDTYQGRVTLPNSQIQRDEKTSSSTPLTFLHSTYRLLSLVPSSPIATVPLSLALTFPSLLPLHFLVNLIMVSMGHEHGMPQDEHDSSRYCDPFDLWPCIDPLSALSQWRVHWRHRQ